MFASHFGLREDPFGRTSQPPPPFPSRELEEALDHFAYVRARGEPFFLLVGEVGTGKSTAIEAIVRSLEPQARVAVLRHSTLEAKELLVEILRRFGLEVSEGESKPELLSRLEQFLGPSGEGDSAVLIIDEAHLLPLSSLEELRLLSNLTDGDRPLLQTCLVGQPELVERLRGHRMRPLRQRIAVRYIVGALSREETTAYLVHRLREAGAEQPAEVFTERALDAIHEISGGLPREINVIANQAMLTAYLEDARVVRETYVRSTTRDYGFEGLRLSRGAELAESQDVPAKDEEPSSLASQEVPLGEPVEEPADVDVAESSDAPMFLDTGGERRFPVRGAIVTAAVLVLMGAGVSVLFRSIERIDHGSFPPPPAPASKVMRRAADAVPAAPVDALLRQSTEAAPPGRTEDPVPIPASAPPASPMRSRESRAVAVMLPQAPAPSSSMTAAAADRVELGAKLARSGQLPEAIAAFREAAAIDPGYPKAHYNLGLSLLESGRPAEAVDALRRAVELEPEDGLAHRSLGIALGEAGALEEAVRALQRAVALRPEDALAFRHLGRTFRRLGNADEAARAAARAVALQPNDPELHHELGFSLRESGRLADARIALEKAVELDPNLAAAHYSLGVILLELGEATNAQQQLDEAKRLGFMPR